MFAKILRGLGKVRRPRRSARLVIDGLESRVVPVLDQVFDMGSAVNVTLSTSVAYFNTEQEQAQSFTNGVTGYLTQVDLYVSTFSGTVGPLEIDIRAANSDGRPTSGAGEVIYSTSIPVEEVSEIGWTTVDLSGAGIRAIEGQRLAVVISVGNVPNADITYWWGGRWDDPYAGGRFTGRSPGSPEWGGDPGWDLAFRTYVDPVPIEPPVVTPSGTQADYVENATPVLLDPAATLTDPNTPDFRGGSLTVSITANGVAADRLMIRNEGTGTGQIGVAGSTVTYGGTAIGTFAGGNGTTPLTVTFNSSATPDAAQALVRNLTFDTNSENPATAPRTIELVVNDGFGGISDPVEVTVTVAAVNDPPALASNTGMTVAEGASGTITAARLSSTDPDHAAAGLTYTVTSAPVNGIIRKSGTPVTTFTQADISANQITYLHNGAENTFDSFQFTVSDGTATTATATFNITINPVNDAPVLTTNTGVTVNEAGSVAITSAQLAASDVDSTTAQVRFTVTVAPTRGSIRRNGTPVSSFTQAEINNGLMTYQHNGGGSAPDGFTFTVTDGIQTTAAATFAITVQPLGPPPITLDPQGGIVTFAGKDDDDHVELFAVDIGGGQFALGHNFVIPGLAGNTDLDPNTPGAQQLILGSGSTPLITVDLKAGNDSLGINNTGGHFTTPVAYEGGTGRDLLRLTGTLANTWTLTAANSGSVTGTTVTFTGAEDLTGSAGDDSFVFAAGASVGLLDGGAGTNALDYRALDTPVEVFLSAGSASHTDGVTGVRTAFGGSAADLLAGSADADVLVGDGGDDSVLGGGGDDVLTGGAGNDLIVGGVGIDRITETIPKALAITLTNVSLVGGTDTGVDLLNGVESASLTGGAGNDVIKANKFTLGSVMLDGAAGNDKLYGGTQGDLLLGGDGKDLLVGGAGNDTFTGGRGNDVLNGGAGDDLVRETDITGTNVTLTGGRLKTDLLALGIDVLMSINRAFLSLATTETVGRTITAAGFRAGPVTLIGGAGADTLIGTIRSGDVLMGGAGADTLNSGKGADTVDGGPDPDVHVTLGGAAIDDTVIDL